MKPRSPGAAGFTTPHGGLAAKKRIDSEEMTLDSPKPPISGPRTRQGAVMPRSRSKQSKTENVLGASARVHRVRTASETLPGEATTWHPVQDSPVKRAVATQRSESGLEPVAERSRRGHTEA